MKEKTADIDILEEKEKIKDKLFPITHINGYINLYEQKEARIYTSELSRWQSATKDSLNLIETLIAENKELKEENEGLKTKLDTLIEKYKELKEMLKNRIEYTNKLEEDLFQNSSNYVIPKSKIKVKIEEIKNECKYCDFTDEFCQELLMNNNCTQGNTLKVLQSLLEKEE